MQFIIHNMQTRGTLRYALTIALLPKINCRQEFRGRAQSHKCLILNMLKGMRSSRVQVIMYNRVTLPALEAEILEANSNSKAAYDKKRYIRIGESNSVSALCLEFPSMAIAATYQLLFLRAVCGSTIR